MKVKNLKLLTVGFAANSIIGSIGLVYLLARDNPVDSITGGHFLGLEDLLIPVLHFGLSLGLAFKIDLYIEDLYQKFRKIHFYKDIRSDYEFASYNKNNYNIDFYGGMLSDLEKMFLEKNIPLKRVLLK